MNESDLSLARRMWIASKIYSSVRSHFAHWEAIPDLDFDQAFQEYLDEASTAPDRRSFSLSTMRLFARLHNGHTGFEDLQLVRDDAGPVGFTAEPGAGGWVVRKSLLTVLPPGSVIRNIAGEPAEDFLERLSGYMPASSSETALRMVWSASFLFPESFELELDDGRKVLIRRGEQDLTPLPPRTLRMEVLDGEIAQLTIPSFADPAAEEEALRLIESQASAAALIVDVRANGGGTTPERLIRALMDRPWREMAEATPVAIGAFAAAAQVARLGWTQGLDDGSRGSLEALSRFDGAKLITAPALQQPSSPLFRGPLFVLIDRDCSSACEDFVMPLGWTGRATVLGEPTRGSTGQPYYFDFGDGLGFRVGARRAYFPDGSPFEGVGIRPKEEVRPTVEALRRGEDPVLARALELARAATTAER